jgi:serine/threonine-protein kinase
MVTPDGSIKVMDFGISQTTDTQTLHTLEDAGGPMGTAAYLAPEQATGGRADARSDVYALGAVLYHMLTGRPPFVGDTAVSLVHQHLNDQPEPPSRWNAAVGPELDRVAMRALSKDPADRHPSAAALRDELSAVLGDDPGPAAGTSPTAPTEALVPVPTRPIETLEPAPPAPSGPPAHTTPIAATPRPARRRRSKGILLAVAVLVLGAVSAYALASVDTNGAGGLDIATTVSFPTAANPGVAQALSDLQGALNQDMRSGHLSETAANAIERGVVTAVDDFSAGRIEEGARSIDDLAATVEDSLASGDITSPTDANHLMGLLGTLSDAMRATLPIPGGDAPKGGEHGHGGDDHGHRGRGGGD